MEDNEIERETRFDLAIVVLLLLLFVPFACFSQHNNPPAPTTVEKVQEDWNTINNAITAGNAATAAASSF